MKIDTLHICNVICRNIDSIKCMIQKGGAYNDVVEVKLSSHRKYKSADTFMVSGGLPVY